MNSEWQVWFAWHPVVVNGRRVWWESVYRRQQRESISTVSYVTWWEYRDIADFKKEQGMKTQSSSTYWARIFIAGPIEVAKQIIREECLREGLCVTIEPTTFIYTGGEEVGYVVGLNNYPRFPKSTEDIDLRAEDLARKLLDKTFQHSCMVQTPHITLWFSKRPE